MALSGLAFLTLSGDFAFNDSQYLTRGFDFLGNIKKQDERYIPNHNKHHTASRYFEIPFALFFAGVSYSETSPGKKKKRKT